MTVPIPTMTRPGATGRAPGRRRPRRRARAGRRTARLAAGWAGWASGSAALFVFLLFSFGLELWTDALWYPERRLRRGLLDAAQRPAGPVRGGRGRRPRDPRSGTSWLAGRLAPAASDGSGGGSIRGFFDRLNEAAEAEPRRPDRESAGRGAAGHVRHRRHPGPDAVAGAALIGVAVLVALTIGGSVAARLGDGAAVGEPRAVLRPTLPRSSTPCSGATSGSSCSSCRSCAWCRRCSTGSSWRRSVAVGVRYLVGGSRGGLVFTTPVRVHLGGPRRAVPAVGRVRLPARQVRARVQRPRRRDRRQLHGPERPVLRLRRPDRHLRAGRGIPRRRRVHQDAVAARTDRRRLVPRLARHRTGLPRGDPAPDRGQPNQFARKSATSRNNIAMTRLAYGLDSWEDDRPFRGESVLSEARHRVRGRHVPQRPPVGLPAARGQSLDQLQTVRRYYDFHDVDTDRYIIDGVQRQVMLSARELALDQNPGATGCVNQRIDYTHGIGAAMVPVNEVANEGQPRLFIGNLPPVSNGGRSGDHPAADLLRGAADRLHRRRCAPERVRLSDRRRRRHRRRRDGDPLDRHDRDRPGHDAHAAPVRAALPRPRPAHQRPDHRREPAAVPPVARRPTRADRAVPALRQGSLSRHRSRRAAESTSRTPTRRPTDSRTPRRSTRDSSSRRPSARMRSTTSATASRSPMDAYDGTMHFYVADPTDPIIRAYRACSRRCSSRCRPCRAGLSAAPARPRGAVQRPDPRVRALPRHGAPSSSSAPTTCGPCPQGQTSEQTLPSEAYYVVMRMPGEPEAEFLLLQPMVPVGRPNMIAWVAAREGCSELRRDPGLPLPGGDDDLRAGPDRGPDRPGPGHQPAGHAVGTIGQQGHPRQPHRRADRPTRSSTSSRSTCSRPRSAFPEFRRIVVASPREVVWAETLGRPSTSCSSRRAA